MIKDYIVRVYRFDGQKWNLNLFMSMDEFKRSKVRRDLVKCAVKTLPDTIALLYIQDSANLLAQNIINHGSDSVFVVIHKEDYRHDPIDQCHPSFFIPKKFKEESLK